VIKIKKIGVNSIKIKNENKILLIVYENIFKKYKNLR